MKNIFYAFICICLYTLTSCTDESMFLSGTGINDQFPWEYEQIDLTYATVFDEDGGIMDTVKHEISIVAEKEKIHNGTSLIELETSSIDCIDKDGIFYVNYKIDDNSYNYQLTVDGYFLEYQGRKLKPRKNYKIFIHVINDSLQQDPFKHVKKTTNILKYQDVVLDTANTRIEVSKDAVVLDSCLLVRSEHKNFIQNAEINGSILLVKGINRAIFKKYWSNGETIEDTIEYELVYKFQISAPNNIVANNIVGQTYTVTNGQVNIGGGNFTFTPLNKECQSVIYNGVDYTNQVLKCNPHVKKIHVMNSSNIEIIVFENNEDDFAKASFAINIEDEITVTEIQKSFSHISFNNPTINGNNISITCNNIASFVKILSNGTSTTAEQVPYTWNNNFHANIPTYSSNVIGQTFFFSEDGTAIAEGQMMSVNFTSRIISDIIYEGTNYKNTAPICSINPEKISFREGFADIYFKEGNETVVAIINVSYQTVEVLNGTLIAGWLTDSFMNQHQNYEGTYLHIMATVNNNYVVYSRRQGTNNWTVTNLTNSEAANMLGSGRAAAWVYNGSQYIMGTVQAIARTDAPDRWVLEYFQLDGQLAYRLGKNAETIMGGIYRHPVRDTGSNNNGLLSIDGSWFVGNNQ